MRGGSLSDDGIIDGTEAGTRAETPLGGETVVMRPWMGLRLGLELELDLLLQGDMTTNGTRARSLQW